MQGPGSLKCFTQALHGSTLREKSGSETLDNDGTDTKREIRNTVPFSGSNCRFPPYRRTATIGAAAAVCVLKRGNTVRIDVEQSLKDPIRTDEESRPQSRAECWSGQTLKVTGTGPLTNKEVQSWNDIKAEKCNGPYSENVTLFAGPSIYEIGCCDISNDDDSQEERKNIGKKAEEARDLKRQVNPYDGVGTVGNNGNLYEYGPELTEGKVSVDHFSLTTAVSIFMRAEKPQKSTSPLRC